MDSDSTAYPSYNARKKTNVRMWVQSMARRIIAHFDKASTGNERSAESEQFIPTTRDSDQIGLFVGLSDLKSY